MKAKKSLGQHFLTSRALAETIVSAGNVDKKDIVLEAGPGKGILTKALLKKAKKVIAVEKDEVLAEYLQKTFAKEIKNKKLVIEKGDILSFKPERHRLQSGNYKIVANIPYYITGHFIRYFLSHKIQPKGMTLLVQKEVAERIAKDRKESLLSISVKVYGQPKYIRTVKAGSFYPKPKVDSAILHIENISRCFFQKPLTNDERKFFKTLKAGFAHKRKLLARNLEEAARKEEIQKSFQKCNTPPSTRAEDVSLAEWHCLTKALQ